MRDPRKFNMTGKMKITAKLSSTGEILDLYHLIEESFRNAPLQSVEDSVEKDLEKIAEKPGTTLYKTLTSFSYTDLETVKEFNFGDVLLEVFLPYCFHLPNHLDILIKIPEENIEAMVTLHKIWTSYAETPESKSDEIDLYAENIPLYFKNSTILGSQLPVEPEKGWDQYITGKNIEKVNDSNGTFRYSKVYLQLKLAVPSNIEKLKDKRREKLINKISETALKVVNLIIDNYRIVTNEIHVRRLGRLNINLIYFIKENVGYYLSNFSVSTAMINRSRKEIKQLEQNLQNGTKPDLYRLLLLNAKSSFDSKDFTLAIVESFQALEIFLENYLVSEYKKVGYKEVDYKKRLKQFWMTKDRLNKLLRELKKTP